MSNSNYSHQLKMHQVHDLQDMGRELSTLSDVAHTVWHAMKSEGEANIIGCQFDLANRIYDLHEKLEAFTKERAAEAEGLAELTDTRSAEVASHE